MAFNDTLFQLGMDLTRSSTAQTEDHSRPNAVNDRSSRDTANVRSDNPSAPLSTFFVDLHGVKRFSDADSADMAFRRAVASLGFEPKRVFVDPLKDGGLAGVAVLANGHVSLAACPRSGIVALDARGNLDVAASDLLMAFAKAFDAREAVIRKTRRASANSAAPVHLADHSASARRRVAGSEARRAA